MPKVIVQRVRLNAPPNVLFNTYLDSRKHAAMTSRRVRLERKVGGTFSAFNGLITGRNLLLVPNRLIVQAWRAKHWKKTDLDSILFLKFQKVRGAGQVELVHVNVPNHDYAEVKKGWRTYYWKPWREYLKSAELKRRTVRMKYRSTHRRVG